MRKNIFLIDDSFDSISRRDTLSGAGYNVECSDTVQGASQRWQKSKFDLILFAITTNLSGAYALLREIRMIQPGQCATVLFTQKNRLSELRLDGKIISQAEGPDDLLGKVELLLRLSMQPLECRAAIA